MLLLWKEGIAYWKVALGYAFVGIGVGFAGTPASHSLTGSVPVKRAGMASGTADLQRDLGGAIMQSILGALLTAGYAAAVATSIGSSPNAQLVTSDVENALEKSFSSAANVAAALPAIFGSHYQRREVGVPAGSALGLPGRHRRDPGRRRAGVFHVPEEGPRGAAARRVPRAGHSWDRVPTAAGALAR